MLIDAIRRVRAAGEVGRPCSRASARHVRGRIAAAAAVGVVVVGAAAIWLGLQVEGARGQAAPPASGRHAVEVSLACDGWTRANVDLGVFASGFAYDGTKVDEHLVFEGPGIAPLDLNTGFYEFALQMPQIMQEDGAVLVAGDPVAVRLEGSADETLQVTVSYAAVEDPALADDNLAAIAQASFLDQADADRALARALERHRREEG